MSFTIGYVGMSHLGINYAAASAIKGCQCICYDEQQARHKNILEPGLDVALSNNKYRMLFTTDITALAGCDIIYISLDVPTDERGISDLSQVNGLIEHLSTNLGNSTAAILVILCQVPPGFTMNIAETIQWPQHKIYYQVETLIFGQALARALSPERFIIGCRDVSKVDQRYLEYLALFDCPVLPMKYASAELAKIAINCFLVASVGMTNTLSELCEEIGASWDEIIPALRLDKRIGQHAYLAPGLGIAGGNLERDLVTVRNLAQQFGTDSGVVRALQHNSDYRKDWVLKILSEVTKGRAKVKLTVWGLTYKADTHSLKNSPALLLLTSLVNSQKFSLTAFDPVINQLDLKVKLATSAVAALAGADILVVMTPWDEFKAISGADIVAAMAGKIVIDPFGVVCDKIAQVTDDYCCYKLGNR